MSPKMSKKKSWAVQFKEFRVFAECVLDYLRSQVLATFQDNLCGHVSSFRGWTPTLCWGSPQIGTGQQTCVLRSSSRKKRLFILRLLHCIVLNSFVLLSLSVKFVWHFHLQSYWLEETNRVGKCNHYMYRGESVFFARFDGESSHRGNVLAI